MQIPAMWDMLRNHDSTAHRKAMEGWRQSYELVLMHRTQVEKYKEKLITAWPPSRNKAAAAYIERLDNLIENLTETYNAAIANHRTYTTIIGAVDAAKWELDRIQQEHSTNQTALDKYTAELASRPVHYGKYVVPETKPSPVAAGRQEELHLQAVTLMTSLTVELAQAQTALVTPRPYSPKAVRDDGTEPLGSGGVSSILPGISSFSGNTKAPTRISRPSSSDRGAARPTTGTNLGKTEPPPGRAPSIGPILGGTKQPVLPAPPVGTPTTPPNFTPSANFPESFNIPPAQNPSASPITVAPSKTPNGIQFGTTPPAAGTRGASALHGGVIGGVPPIGGMPSGRAGQLGSPTRAGQKINPVGGLIGQDHGARPPQRSSSQRDEETRPQYWDPDNPWETESGMDPILFPRDEQRIDPGPTIGGR
ncbi:hypothetical protein [Actinoplanes sp. CA-252034]|uniref:hypothetical protein n=1 Tax=Actinoplanes sp. CA-252034 TaxID=3239906 RepID=UPI003D971167